MTTFRYGVACEQEKGNDAVKMCYLLAQILEPPGRAHDRVLRVLLYIIGLAASLTCNDGTELPF